MRRNPAARRRATATKGSHRARAMEVQKRGLSIDFFPTVFPLAIRERCSRASVGIPSRPPTDG